MVPVIIVSSWVEIGGDRETENESHTVFENYETREVCCYQNMNYITYCFNRLIPVHSPLGCVPSLAAGCLSTGHV